ncbi:MAG: F0F1 ATP synthase subunit alpha [Kiritimatiellae bacterium]|nr:F0F1 ATP synthase subunit alpha [Kiritimatiellia bacterium]
MSNSRVSPIPPFKITVHEKGRIKDIREIVVRISGLQSCLNGQLVSLGNTVNGIIMGFDEEEVLALVLGDRSALRLGMEVAGVSEPFKIPVGDGFLGRMVTALGLPCDEGPPIEPDMHLPIFRDSPPIVARNPVDEFLPTGTKIVDIMVPVAKGQRMLILGDRITGKTVLGLDAIINQRTRDVVCIYCCIGKSLSSLEKVVTILRQKKALDYTVIMVATDSSPVGEQYLVPFSAATMGDYFASQGHDVLVVFDDLTKHAWAYRQLSLLLDRPPGREAYPGDIFYVQTQLMERAGNFNEAYGGGSMTFLGIAETLQGDLAGYIPSNLASMCDGQIVLSSTTFAEGYRPAIDFGLSISIIGGRVQPPILKELSRGLRAEHAQYREVLALSRLQSGVSEQSARILNRGAAILQLLQQGQYEPAPFAEEVLLLYALHTHRVDMLPDEEKQRFRKEIYGFARNFDARFVENLEMATHLTPEIEEGLDAVLDAYFTGKGNEKGRGRGR